MQMTILGQAIALAALKQAGFAPQLARSHQIGPGRKPPFRYTPPRVLPEPVQPEDIAYRDAARARMAAKNARRAEMMARHRHIPSSRQIAAEKAASRALFEAAEAKRQKRGGRHAPAR